MRVPLTLSTAGGALIAGIVGGWLRSVKPKFGRIPTPTVWFMNSVGLNIFIAIVGISAGPGFVNGLKTQGIGLFLWGALATTAPLVLGMFTAKYLFKFHDALTLGIVSGARTTTASLGLVCDSAGRAVFRRSALKKKNTYAWSAIQFDDLGPHGHPPSCCCLEAATTGLKPPRKPT